MNIRVQTGVHASDLSASATICTTGWNAALRRRRPLECSNQWSSARPLRSVTMRFTPLRIKVRGFRFQSPVVPSVRGLNSTDGEPTARPPIQTAASCRLTPAAPRSLRDTQTRIVPPSDVIKLDDRLFYLLQPPLETLLSGSSLAMPICPFPYQLAGISFLYPRHAAILADEMGLGKTMQAITAMRLLLHAGQIRHVLLVCPKPLVTNWQREFQIWAPEIPICVIEGDQSRRRWKWNLDDVPVKVSNYEALLRDREDVGGGFRHFDLVVLDEAQRIKNRSSSSHQVVCSVARTRSWALTGTPVENTSDDLVGIFEFLVAGYLRTGLTPRRLREATRDYIIRRTKDQVLADLPPKLYRDAPVELSAAQHSSYQRAERDGVVHLTNLGEAVSIQHVFELILRLKQICNFDPATGRSSKLDRLEADLEEVAASGKKAIVFSQWVSTLEELKRRLRRFGPVEYHGRIPSQHRDGVIDRLRRDRDTHVILMSYGAGSVGLNLQFCEYVFLFDRWWNPAVEDQAINRAHRIGAAGPVTVTRFVTLATIEERIDQILSQKRELFATILADTHRPASAGLSQAELFGLFNLQVPGGRLKVSPDAA
jgi:SNF2 family DNA or RNA helicase